MVAGCFGDPLRRVSSHGKGAEPVVVVGDVLVRDSTRHRVYPACSIRRTQWDHHLPPASQTCPPPRFQSGIRTVPQYPTRPRGLTKSGSAKSPAKEASTSAGSNCWYLRKVRRRGGATRGLSAYGARSPNRPHARMPVQYAHFQTPPRAKAPASRRIQAKTDRCARGSGNQHVGLRICIRPSRGHDVFVCLTPSCASPTPSVYSVHGAIDNNAGRVPFRRGKRVAASSCRVDMPRTVGFSRGARRPWPR